MTINGTTTQPGEALSMLDFVRSYGRRKFEQGLETFKDLLTEPLDAETHELIAGCWEKAAVQLYESEIPVETITVQTWIQTVTELIAAELAESSLEGAHAASESN